jgi:glycosyltransferase involved in cell wall biosynthesis
MVLDVEQAQRGVAVLCTIAGAGPLRRGMANLACSSSVGNTPHTLGRTRPEAGEPDVLRAAIIYHMWPHYREAVARAMDRSERVDYTFYGSAETFDAIPHADPGRFRRFVRAPFRVGPMHLLWQPKAVGAAFSREYDAIVMLGDPHFVSTWLAASIARLRGIPVLFWTHGWRREEHPAKLVARNVFHRLADRVMVYSERSKQIGVSSGFPTDRITVVYNSLDVDRADEIIAQIESGALDGIRPRSLFAEQDRPLIICTARITPRCRFDLLFEAAAMLAGGGKPINILLVGDGPERPALEAMATKLGIDVHFYGACYDEDVLGQLIYRADLAVSPGKIGLTAMHSLMYGTPAITHGNLNEQMPEVEAVSENLTGTLYDQAKGVTGLANAIAHWFASGRNRAQDRAACRAATHVKWNPNVQAAIIEHAIEELVARRATT